MIENLEVQHPMNNQEKAVGNRKALSSQGTLGTLDPSQHSLKPQAIKVSATLKIAIFSYLRFQRFQIDMLESFLLKKKIRRKYYFCRKISGVKDFFSLIILIVR